MSIFKLPHLVFIESACPAYLARYINADYFIYNKHSCQYALDNNKNIIVSEKAIRFLKVIASLLRFPCTFQGAYGLAYQLSTNKSVISDGLLTEWLYKKNYIKPKQFFSIEQIRSRISAKKNKSLILGSNWVEFGSMRIENYEKLLKTLSKKYPDALYFPHPKENIKLSYKIFDERIILSQKSVEAYCIENGVPDHIIGLGSTALVTLGRITLDEITVEVLKIDPQYFDGEKGDCIDTYLKNKRGITIKIDDLAEITREMLVHLDNINIKISTIEPI